MRSEKSDRRSQRTRQLLHGALIALLLEKRYDELTVQEILDRANVGRSTFYAHFRDKDDLLISNIEHVFRMLSEGHQQGGQGPADILPSLALLEHMQGHLHLYKALARGGASELLFRKLHAFWAQSAEAALAASLSPAAVPALPLPLLATYLAGTLVTLLRWWLDQGAPYSPQEMHRAFQLLVRPAIDKVLGARGQGLGEGSVEH